MNTSVPRASDLFRFSPASVRRRRSSRSCAHPCPATACMTGELFSPASLMGRRFAREWQPGLFLHPASASIIRAPPAPSGPAPVSSTPRQSQARRTCYCHFKTPPRGSCAAIFGAGPFFFVQERARGLWWQIDVEFFREMGRACPSLRGGGGLRRAARGVKRRGSAHSTKRRESMAARGRTGGDL